MAAKKKQKPTHAKPDKVPEFIEPQLATLSATTPSGPLWVHEVKFDGYRAQLRVEKGNATVLTRRGYDWSTRFKEIGRAAAKLPDCVIDGEAVVLDSEGRTDFSALQSALAGERSAAITYYAFDLLFLNGEDLRTLKLLERKEKLLAVLNAGGKHLADRIRYSEHFDAPGNRMHESACAMGLEGVVSKRINAAYRSGRNEAWIKSKCGERETFIIGGWRQTAGGVQSLALGEMRGRSFDYVGKARTGFQDQQAILLPRLKAVEVDHITFDRGRPERKDGQHWVRPELQAEVTFTAWTASRHLRHAKFLGLREDAPPAPIPKKDAGKAKGRNIQRLLMGATIPTSEALKRYWTKNGKKALRYLAAACNWPSSLISSAVTAAPASPIAPRQMPPSPRPHRRPSRF